MVNQKMKKYQMNIIYGNEKVSLEEIFKNVLVKELKKELHNSMKKEKRNS